MRDQRQTHGAGVESLTQIRDEHQVAARLRPLLAIELHERLMHPVPRERFTRRAFGLCAFAFVMWIDQVGATTVQIDRPSELPQCERRAFDVPAGATVSPERLPFR